jgi:hypothetical protein
LFVAAHRHATCALFASEDPIRQKDKEESFPAKFSRQFAKDLKNTKLNSRILSPQCHVQTNTFGCVFERRKSCNADFAQRRDFG